MLPSLATVCEQCDTDTNIREYETIIGLTLVLCTDCAADWYGDDDNGDDEIIDTFDTYHYAVA